MSRTQAETDFIDQYTRRLTVLWADQCVRHGDLGANFREAGEAYVEYALGKGWLTKSEPPRVTAKGFNTAKAFLRR